MFNWQKAAGVVLCLGAIVCTGCGVSTEGSRYQMTHGVSPNGYPPAGSGINPGSPAISSMGDHVNSQGIEAEPAKAPKQNIPANLKTTPES
jgi:hypothetical protein